METNQIARLHRMRDYGPSSIEVNRRISDGISSVLADLGFRSLDTPMLEQTDLFVRKSGGEIAGSLYTFGDPGGIDVSLRPEFTPSVIRWFIENIDKGATSHRFQYSGPVFRYGGSRGARYRQFTQCGGELIGIPGPAGDSEILNSAVRCLAGSGIGDYAVRLGHIGIVRELVQSQGLSGPLQMFILSNLDEISAGDEGIDRVTDRAVAAGLIYPSGQARVKMTDGDLAAIPALEALGSSLSGPTGRRTPEQIMARLASRMRQAAQESEFRSALLNVSDLVTSRGTPSDVMESIAEVMERSGASLSRVNDLGSTLTSLSKSVGGEVPIEIDLSFVRGLAYYTGVVFEFSGGLAGDSVALGGGGRYDDLVRAFGGNSTPACGFALNVDELALLSDVSSAEVRA